jgi:transcriptional regulator with XRE-family HTH domain
VKGEDPERAKKAVGRRVAEIRRALGLTQAALAARLGDDEDARPSPQYVGLVEQGRENLTIEALVRLANSLRVPLRALFDPPASMEPTRRGRPRGDGGKRAASEKPSKKATARRAR